MLGGSAAGLTFDHVDPIPQVVINGLMANSNAYGLLLLLAFAIWCVDEKDFAVGRSVIGPVLFPIVLATGIVLTGSRTALLIMGALIIVAAIMRRPIRTGLATASVVVLGLVVALPPLIDGSAAARPLMMNGSGDADLAVWGHLLHPSADEERLRSILRGLSLWASSPVLGTGIGGVDAWYRAAGLQPLVIHNVLVWFLAETGLVGTGIAIVSLALLLRRAVGALAEGGTRIAAARLIVVVAVFSAASMLHDFFYQRGFWFVLGCLMTAMASVRRSRTKVRS
jgi:O-antigen ligase